MNSRDGLPFANHITITDYDSHSTPSGARSIARTALTDTSLQSAIFNPVAAFVTDKIGSRDGVLQGAWLLLALIVFSLVIAIRIRLLGTPLDSAEGEYAYAG